MNTRSLLAPLALVLASPLALAQEAGSPDPGDFLQAPEVIPSPVTGDPSEPDITIREEGERTVYEYRIKGHLYMVKIQPRVGPPYYLFDDNNDGVMDVHDQPPGDISVNQWLIFSWD